MTDQPGYDSLADVYDRTFPEGYSSDVERSAVGLFAAAVRRADAVGPVVDVGCGTGHQADDLRSRGVTVVGVDPSGSMLEHARRRFPDLRLVQDNARLRALGAGPFSGILARYSLIHVAPDELANIFASWAARIGPGGVVMVAFQALESDASGDVEEFDHTVAQAWRWKPDAMAAILTDAGFTERWRLISAAAQDYHRFSECHVLLERD